MGPNGSGKSTLANVIMGHPDLEVTEGQIIFKGEDITEADPDERARMGLFMAFQYPVAIPGVTITKYLRMVMNAHREARGEAEVSLKDFRKLVEEAMELTNVPREFSSRYLNEGFSGGEKKRLEILQLALQKPSIAVLDETDSGLDIDALNIVAHGGQHRRRGTTASASSSSPTTSASCTSCSPSASRSCTTGGSSRRAARSSSSSSSAKATAGSRRGGRRRRLTLVRALADTALAHEFPILAARDSSTSTRGATSQTPRVVLDAMDDYYAQHHASVHRGVYPLAVEATERFEGARERIAGSRARPPAETIFTRNATEALNLVAYAWGDANVGAGDAIVVTEMEHHSNFVPWQLLAQRAGARPALPRRRRRRQARPRRARRAPRRRARARSSPSRTSRTCSARSTRSPRSCARAHAAGAVVVVDGSQAVPQIPVDVSAIGADFYAWTGHKAYGPTGVGVLHGRRELLEAMPPFLGGGDMINSVDFEPTPPGTTCRGSSRPARRRSPKAIGLGAAVDFLRASAWTHVRAHERELIAYALERLARRARADASTAPPTPPSAARSSPSRSTGIHPHDVAEILGRDGVCVRAGHHCAQPLMRRLGVRRHLARVVRRAQHPRGRRRLVDRPRAASRRSSR